MNVILFFTKNDFLILPLVAPLSKHWIVTSQLRQRGGLKILSKGETFKFMYEILEGAVLVDLTCRSSRLEVLCKTGVFRNFVKFTGKHLCQRLFFNKVAGLRALTLLKKRLAQMFSCEFCESSKKIFFTEHLRWLLLYMATPQMFTCLKKNIRDRNMLKLKNKDIRTWRRLNFSTKSVALLVTRQRCIQNLVNHFQRLPIF